MRRRYVTLATAVVAILALAIPVGAAELHDPHQGTACEGGGLVQLHFVQNQIPTGADPGFIHVVFADGTTVIQLADKVNRNNQHWTIRADHESQLVTAWTSVDGAPNQVALEGKLVLSDYDCKKGVPTPPKG